MGAYLEALMERVNHRVDVALGARIDAKTGKSRSARDEMRSDIAKVLKESRGFADERLEAAVEAIGKRLDIKVSEELGRLKAPAQE